MYTFSLVAFASAAAALVAAHAPLGHAVHERRDVSASSSMVKRDRLDRNVVLPMRIGLKQSNLDIAPEWLMEISDPESPKYGQHWTQDQVVEAFQPSDHTVDQVMDWLVASGISKHRITHSNNKQWLAFDALTHEAESLTHAEYYGHEDSKGRTMIACDEYHIPAHLQEHIDYITPGIKGVRTSSAKPVLRKRLRPKPSGSDKSLLKDGPASASVPCSQSITPACLRALYNFTMADQHAKVSPNNSLGIFETGDEYDQLDLNSFFTHYASFIPNGTHPKLDSVDGALAPGPPEDTEGEAVLDFELAFPIVYPQQVILYQVDNFTGEDANGIFNTFLDALDGSYCTYSAYGETGNDPTLDPTYPDPNPGGYKGKLQCGVYKPTNVISISYGEYENELPGYYQKRQCNEYLKLGLQGVTIVVASGDTGVGGGCMTNNKGVQQFSPTQPNSCPWLLNVGATQINNGQTTSDPEVAVNAPSEGYWSSGGFSNLFPVPDYQKNAIAQYYKVANPPYKYYFNGSYENSTGLYNRNGRGIPDVAANGQNIATYTGGGFFLNGGTSASAPIFASLINRIIEERIKIGKGPLGFINPTLYQNPQILNDIVKGSNPGCGTNGFSCAKGWDPVTGLGTPNYPKMLKFFLNQK